MVQKKPSVSPKPVPRPNFQPVAPPPKKKSTAKNIFVVTRERRAYRMVSRNSSTASPSGGAPSWGALDAVDARVSVLSKVGYRKEGERSDTFARAVSVTIAAQPSQRADQARWVSGTLRGRPKAGAVRARGRHGGACLVGVVRQVSTRAGTAAPRSRPRGALGPSQRP